MIEIIQGEERAVTIRLVNENGTPFDLTGNSEITVCFEASSTTITKTKTGGGVVVGPIASPDPKLGEIIATVLIADTNNMPADASGDIETVVDFGGGKVRRVQILGAFSVTAKICT